MIVHLHIIGCLFILLALLHAGFPRYFGWRSQLAALSLINRQMMQVHALFIAIVVLGMGLLCLTSARELTTTVLGERIAWGLALFWFARLAVQLFVYSADLWRGKAFETVVHAVFTALWAYAGVVFLLVALD